MKKRFVTLPEHKNIRKDVETGKYQAYKRIEGKVYYQSLPKIVDCKRWLREFHPDLQDEVSKSPMFKEYYEDYVISRHCDLESSTVEEKKIRVSTFYDDIKNIRMNNIDYDLFRKLVERKKREAGMNPKRLSFDKELKEYRAILQWYKDFRDYTYIVPITKAHFQLGKVRKAIPKRKDMSLDDFKYFIDSFKNPLYQDCAMAQFLCCARISEIAGIQKSDIDLKNNLITMKHMVVWSKNKKFVKLKKYLKANNTKIIQITVPLREVILRQLQLNPDSPYLFSFNGEPLKYRAIQYNYNLTLKLCGLGEYSGTHIMRHTMSTLSRLYSNDLNSVQALTGHSSMKQVEHYAKLSYTAQSKAVDPIVKALGYD